MGGGRNPVEPQTVFGSNTGSPAVPVFQMCFRFSGKWFLRFPFPGNGFWGFPFFTVYNITNMGFLGFPAFRLPVNMVLRFPGWGFHFRIGSPVSEMGCRFPEWVFGFPVSVISPHISQHFPTYGRFEKCEPLRNCFCFPWVYSVRVIPLSRSSPPPPYTHRLCQSTWDH